MMAGYPIFLFFSLLLLNFKGASMLEDNCKTRSCNSSSYLSITFPFRIPEYQSNARCGYNSSFSLSCSTSKQTLLYLPKAEEPFITYNIDYSSQRITVTDPGSCLPRRFLTLDISASPFSFHSFSYYDYYYRYTYYNCTSESVSSWYSSYQVSRMSGNNYTVFVFQTGSSYLDSNKNCTVIKSNVPASSQLSYYPNSWTYLYLYWDEPNCKLCTYRELCGFKGNTNLTECRTETAGTSGSSAKSDSNYSLIFYLLVPALMLLMIIAAFKLRTRNTMASEQQHSNHPEPPLTQIQSTNITTALNEHSIGFSHPVFVLGEGDVLLEPNTSPCAICLCEYKAGDMLKTIEECNHYFHSDCLDEWLRRKATCPVCRKGA